jgi:hypothetical protein
MRSHRRDFSKNDLTWNQSGTRGSILQQSQGEHSDDSGEGEKSRFEECCTSPPLAPLPLNSESLSALKRFPHILRMPTKCDPGANPRFMGFLVSAGSSDLGHIIGHKPVWLK